MRKKLYDQKDVAPSCKNCAYSRPLGEGEQVLCEKTGVRNGDSTCRKFRYDPLSRVPGRAPELPTFSKEDFSL